jgi:hypothetical protein
LGPIPEASTGLLKLPLRDALVAAGQLVGGCLHARTGCPRLRWRYPGAHYALTHGYDGGRTADMPIEAFLAEYVRVALLQQGGPISLGHRGRARLMVRGCGAWRRSRWVARIELLKGDQAGFWKRNGYHRHGDPWQQERNSGRSRSPQRPWLDTQGSDRDASIFQRAGQADPAAPLEMAGPICGQMLDPSCRKHVMEHHESRRRFRPQY